MPISRIDAGFEGISRSFEGTPSESGVLREMQRNGLQAPAAETGQAGEGKGFLDVMKDAFEEVNRHQSEADRSIKEMVSGRNKNIHETLLAVERADSSLKLMMQVRNKVLDAYREIMRMQV